MADLCSMCNEAPATMTWGAPVCTGCAEFLTGVQGDLAQMEADDPDLAAKGRAVEEAAERLFAAGQRRAHERAEAVKALRSDEGGTGGER